VVDELEDGDVTVGIVGTVEGLIVYGDTLGVGTAAQELTPRLLISVDPKGIPVRALPRGVVGDVNVGVDDAARLLDPEPHIPDRPEVSTMAEVIDVPDAADAPDVTVGSDIAAVEGAIIPGAMPPPS
jgi:hypothetical protein